MQDKTCKLCGHSGPEVVTRFSHVGGQGYVTIDECGDRIACWERWDEQHATPYQQQVKAVGCLLINRGWWYTNPIQTQKYRGIKDCIKSDHSKLIWLLYLVLLSLYLVYFGLIISGWLK